MVKTTSLHSYITPEGKVYSVESSKSDRFDDGRGNKSQRDDEHLNTCVCGWYKYQKRYLAKRVNNYWNRGLK